MSQSKWGMVVWMWGVAACSGGTPAPCATDAGPHCPATWGEARPLCNFSGSPTACGPPGLECRYPGAGDVADCASYAVAGCVSVDGGRAEWVCAQ